MISKRLIDLVGKRFGHWIVVSRAEDGKDYRIRWNCKCDCGKEKIVQGDGLKSGRSTNCGCLHPNRLINLTGKRFGKIVVLKRMANSMWLCQCSCGKELEVSSGKLRNGQRSCGTCNRVSLHIANGGEEIALKKCTKCKKHLPTNRFHKSKKSYDGFRARCIDCRKERLREYRKTNSKAVNMRAKKYRDSTPEKQKIYRKRSSDKILSTIKGKINNRMRVGIHQSLNGNKNNLRWLSLVPYTLDDLIKRLDSTMPKDYTWDDYSRLHIDHIIPIASFDFCSSQDIGFHRCWALNNLQLLPARENFSKGAKTDYYHKKELMVRGMA